MNTDTEKLLIAQRAAEWLIRLETATPEEREEFWNWLRESPLHVREVLAAQACHIELRRLLKDGRIDANKFQRSLCNVHEIGNAELPGIQQDPARTGSAFFRAPLTATTAVRRVRWIVVAAALFTALLAVAAVVLYGTAHKNMTTATSEMPL